MRTMRAMRLMEVVVATALVAGACARGRVPAVPVIAADGDASVLVGKWAGDYSNPATGRSGSIVFSLAAGRDTAAGDVVMVPSGASEPLRRAPGGAAAVYSADGAPVAVLTPRASSAPLTIRFVRVAGDSVAGMLDPYQSPDCNCVLSTRFVGRVRGDRIEGTFETRGSPGNQPQVGRWQVRRTR